MFAAGLPNTGMASLLRISRILGEAWEMTSHARNRVLGGGALVALLTSLTVGPVWIANDMEKALAAQVNEAFHQAHLAAGVEMHGRVALITASDPEVLGQAASVAGGIPGIERTVTGVAPAPTQTRVPAPGPSSPPATSPSVTSGVTPKPTATTTPTVTPTPTVAPLPATVTILFGGGTSDLMPQNEVVVDELAALLAGRPELAASIIGHTDNGLTESERMALGLARAVTIQQALVGRGIAQERLWVDTRGGHEPVGDNATEEGLEMNRRVEVSFVVVG